MSRSGVPSAALIAKRLHLSERSFSRRMQHEGVSYPKLVDTVRNEVANVARKIEMYSLPDLDGPLQPVD